MLPPGVLEDEGVDRGIIFVAAMAGLERQFEFIKTEWLNQDCSSGFRTTRIHWWDRTTVATSSPFPNCRPPADVPTFVVNRGGESFFVPSLSSHALAARALHLSRAMPSLGRAGPVRAPFLRAAPAALPRGCRRRCRLPRRGLRGDRGRRGVHERAGGRLDPARDLDRTAFFSDVTEDREAVAHDVARRPRSLESPLACGVDFRRALAPARGQRVQDDHVQRHHSQ